MKTIYLAGPITGLDYKAATEWRNEIKEDFRDVGYRVIDPMEGEADTLNEQHPDLHRRVSEIVNLDKFYVDQSDIIFANFENYAPEASVGTISEIAWAFADDKIIIAVVPEGSPYDRAWMNVLYTFKVKTFDEGIKQLASIQ
jgi:nucleoside 2-deoxyribosyltransferase